MPDKNDFNKDTDRDVRPTKGQESNENWDDTSEAAPETNVSESGEGIRRIDTETNTTGYGSSQKSDRGNVGPLDSDFSQLPSEKFRNRGSSSSGQGID